jgi:hypothetical protein
MNRYAYCVNNPLKYIDPTGNIYAGGYTWGGSASDWPNADGGDDAIQRVLEQMEDERQFKIGFIEAFLLQIYGSSPPYMCYESCVGLYEVVTGQRSIWDTNTPAEMWQDIKAYYDTSTPRGLGRISGLGTFIALTAYAGFKGAKVPRGAGTAAATTSSSKALVPYFPPNRGALGGWTKTILSPGTSISRYGSELGRYASPYGTSFTMRSLPSGTQVQEAIYMVTKKGLEVEQSTVIPWYNQQGFGVQYYLPDTVGNLVNDGYLIRVPK